MGDEIKIERKFVSVDEFSQVTGKKPATIRKWLREGKIKAKKIGAEWLIFKSELENLLRKDNE